MTCDNVTPPPDKYDIGYTPPYIVEYASLQRLQQLTGMYVPLCGWVNVRVDPPIVYIRKGTSNTSEILRHEVGHVRGWRH